MLTDLCQELKNWFDRDKPKFFGKFAIHDNDIFYVEIGDTEVSLSNLGLAENQYFRIIGSVFNDGVVKYDTATLETLTEETFNGAVWLMAIPPAVIVLNQRIEDWQTKYGDASLSPFTSESFGGYSYSKGSSSSGNGGNANSWQAIFKNELNRWRKI